jgi:hypothetical protein
MSEEITSLKTVFSDEGLIIPGVINDWTGKDG